MPVETLTYTYTSQAEVQRLISTEGVQLRITDLTGTNATDYWTELIAEATDIVNQYCLGYYEAEEMADNRWVRSRATWIALALLCKRRANPVPGSILDRYEEIIADLNGVLIGKFMIPRLGTRSDMLPSLSNLRVDDRYRTRKLRVNPNISTGVIGSNQDLSFDWTWDWF